MLKGETQVLFVVWQAITADTELNFRIKRVSWAAISSEQEE